MTPAACRPPRPLPVERPPRDPPPRRQPDPPRAGRHDRPGRRLRRGLRLRARDPVDGRRRRTRPALHDVRARPGDGRQPGQGGGAGALLRRRRRADPHEHVPARRLAPPARQHALSVDLRQQHRGPLRPDRLPALLPARRGRRGLDPGLDRPDLDRPDHRRVGRDRRASSAPTWSCIPRARVLSLVFLGFFFQLHPGAGPDRARVWFVLQLVDGSRRSAPTASNGGVALFAHIGGFLAGAVVGRRPAAAGRPAAAPARARPIRVG